MKSNESIVSSEHNCVDSARRVAYLRHSDVHKFQLFHHKFRQCRHRDRCRCAEHRFFKCWKRLVYIVGWHEMERDMILCSRSRRGSCCRGSSSSIRSSSGRRRRTRFYRWRIQSVIESLSLDRRRGTSRRPTIGESRVVRTCVALACSRARLVGSFSRCILSYSLWEDHINNILDQRVRPARCESGAELFGTGGIDVNEWSEQVKIVINVCRH